MPNMSLPATANSTAVAHANMHAGAKSSPAKAARDYLLASPPAEDTKSAFGQLVSQFAKGETP
jgi:hypothetical protein